VVAERLGHASPTLTPNVYHHILVASRRVKEKRRSYVLDLEELLKGPANRPQA